MDPFN